MGCVVNPLFLQIGKAFWFSAVALHDVGLAVEIFDEGT